MIKRYQKAYVALAVVIAVSLLSFGSWKIIGLHSTHNDVSQKAVQADDGVEKKQAPSSEVEPTSKGAVITSGDSEFGAMLFNDAQQAIYIWQVEDTAEPECYGDCARAWPPVLTDGKPRAAGSIKSELLGTTTRNDGTTQVTYNGHPLYYYAHEKAGEVKCHNISTHGGLWWVIQPNGLRAN